MSVRVFWRYWGFHRSESTNAYHLTLGPVVVSVKK